MNMQSIIDAIRTAHNFSYNDLGKATGATPQGIFKKVRQQKGIGVDAALELLDVMGYEMVIVRKGETSLTSRNCYRVERGE